MDLRMNQFSLPSHYDVFDCENGYCFKTDYGNTYFITFIKYPTISEYLSVDVYMMNIDRADDSNHRNGSDNKVRNTILFIIWNFFTLHNDALITICDILDGRQACRRRLFNKWFNEFSGNELSKLDATCLIDETETYASMIFRNDINNRTELEYEFSLLNDINFYN